MNIILLITFICHEVNLSMDEGLFASRHFPTFYNTNINEKAHHAQVIINHIFWLFHFYCKFTVNSECIQIFPLINVIGAGSVVGGSPDLWGDDAGVGPII